MPLSEYQPNNLNMAIRLATTLSLPSDSHIVSIRCGWTQDSKSWMIEKVQLNRLDSSETHNSVNWVSEGIMEVQEIQMVN